MHTNACCLLSSVPWLSYVAQQHEIGRPRFLLPAHRVSKIITFITKCITTQRESGYDDGEIKQTLRRMQAECDFWLKLALS